MLTKEQFEGIAVGDIVEGVPLFPALTQEKVLLRTAQKAHDKAEFVVTYLGVTIGKWIAKLNSQGGLEWTTN